MNCEERRRNTPTHTTTWQQLLQNGKAAAVRVCNTADIHSSDAGAINIDQLTTSEHGDETTATTLCKLFPATAMTYSDFWSSEQLPIKSTTSQIFARKLCFPQVTEKFAYLMGIHRDLS